MEKKKEESDSTLTRASYGGKKDRTAFQLGGGGFAISPRGGFWTGKILESIGSFVKKERILCSGLGGRGWKRS